MTTLDPEDFERQDRVGRPADPGAAAADRRRRRPPCPPGEPGEIVGLGCLTMERYHNRPDATLESTWIDPEGRRWLRTGDIGRLDDEGFLYLVDRKKDLILSGGQNVYPADLEAVLMQHAAVAEVAVIGIPSERWGETPLALVVRRAAEPVESVALRDWANARLGKQQRISELRFVESLPRNPNGKILKRELRREYQHMNDTSGYLEHFVTLRDGLRMYCREYGATHREGPAVLCLPGLTRNSRDFESLARGLSQPVAGADARPARPRPLRLRPDLAELPAAHLRRRRRRTAAAARRVARVVVVGTSLGGLIAMLMAALTRGARRRRAERRRPGARPGGARAHRGLRGQAAAGAQLGRRRGAGARSTASLPDYTDEDWMRFARAAYRETARQARARHGPEDRRCDARGARRRRTGPLAVVRHAGDGARRSRSAARPPTSSRPRPSRPCARASRTCARCWCRRAAMRRRSTSRSAAPRSTRFLSRVP